MSQEKLFAMARFPLIYFCACEMIIRHYLPLFSLSWTDTFWRKHLGDPIFHSEAEALGGRSVVAAEGNECGEGARIFRGVSYCRRPP